MDYLAQMGLGRDQKASLLQSDSLNNESDREMQNVGGLNLNSSSGDDVEKGSLTCTTCADSKLSKETDSTQSFREERRDSNEDKACFLCLESDLRCDPLRKCCSQCSAMTHAKCWAEWRYKQRVASESILTAYCCVDVLW